MVSTFQIVIADDVVSYKLNQKFAFSIPLGTLVGAVVVVVVVAGAVVAVPGRHWL